MEYIEEILTKCQKNGKVEIVSILMAAVFFLVANSIIMNFFRTSKLFALMLFVGLLLMPTIGYLLGTKLGKVLFKDKKVEFNKTKLYKNLERSGYLNKFIDEINRTMNNESTIKYYDETLNVGLLMTEAWFVYIDTKHPKFVKTNEIHKISDVLCGSKYAMCLELKDNTHVKLERLSYEKIERKVKNRYPNIKIGEGIIEE